MTEKYETLTKFSQEQKVLITKGFYKNMIGIIKDYKIVKDEIIYTLESENTKTGKIQKIDVKENFLRKYSFLPW